MNVVFVHPLFHSPPLVCAGRFTGSAALVCVLALMFVICVMAFLSLSDRDPHWYSSQGKI